MHGACKRSFTCKRASRQPPSRLPRLCTVPSSNTLNRLPTSTPITDRTSSHTSSNLSPAMAARRANRLVNLKKNAEAMSEM